MAQHTIFDTRNIAILIWHSMLMEDICRTYALYLIYVHIIGEVVLRIRLSRVCYTEERRKDEMQFLTFLGLECNCCSIARLHLLDRTIFIHKNGGV